MEFGEALGKVQGLKRDTCPKKTRTRRAINGYLQSSPEILFHFGYTLMAFPCFRRQRRSPAEIGGISPSDKCRVVGSFLQVAIKALYKPLNHYMWGIVATKRCPSSFLDSMECTCKPCLKLGLPNFEWLRLKVMYCLCSGLNRTTPQNFSRQKLSTLFRIKFRRFPRSGFSSFSWRHPSIA